MAATVGSLRIELSASIAQFQDDLGKAASSVKDLSRTFSAVASDFKKTGAQIEAIGASLTKTFTLPLVGLAAAATTAAADVNAGFNAIRAATGATGDSLTALEQSFSTVFKNVPDDAKTVAAAMSQISIRTGDVGKPLEDLTTQLVNLAHVTKSSIQPLADGVTRAFGDWSIATVNQSSAMDFLFKASEKTGIGVQHLTDLIVQFGAPLRAMGFTFEQSAALLGKFQADGVNVETVLAGMRFALGKFAAAGKDPVQAFKDVQQAILGAGSQADATKIAFDAFGRRAATDMARAIIEGRFAIDDLVKSLKDSHETINATAADTRTFAEHWTELSHSVEVALQPLGNKLLSVLDGLRPSLERMADTLAKVVTAFLQLPQPVQNTTIAIGAALAALGPLTFIFGDAVKAIGTLVGAFGKTGVATRAIVGSLGLVEKAMGALGSAVLVDGALMFEWGKDTVAIGGWLGQLGGVLVTLVSAGLGPLTAALEAVGVAFAVLASPITLVVGAIAGVGLGIVVLTGHWADLKAVMSTAVQAVQDVGTLLWWLAKGAVSDLVGGLVDLAKWLGSGIISGFESLLSVAKALVTPFVDLATTIAGPVIEAFQVMVAWVKDHIPTWLIALILKIEGVGAATKDLAVNGAQALHDYANAVRDMAKDVEAGFQQANKALDSYRQSITDRAIPNAALEIGAALALLKSQLGGLGKDSGNGFDDLTAALKAARAELSALSSHDLAALTAAVKSGAFTMKEIEDETSLSSLALKLFQGDVRDAAKELKASQGIFDQYKKKVAELAPALTDAFKFNVSADFIKRQFGPMIQDTEDLSKILGDDVAKIPQVINDAFLKVTIQEGTDKLQKEFAKFGEDLNKQVGKDMERVNATVIKTLSVIISEGNSTADAEAQFSIQGLKNQITNLEQVDGETAKSHELRKQLAAEEFQYQVGLIQREGQTKKDALDATVMDYEDYNKAVDAIEDGIAAKIGLASQAYQQRMKEMQTSTKRWTDSLGDISSAFSSIASASGGAFSEVAKDIGSVVSALGSATKAANDLKKATQAYQIAVDNGDIQGQYAATAGKIAAVANGIASVAQATSSKNKAAAIGGGALSGGITGAAIGSIVPGIGTAIGFGVGATVGALVGLFRSIHQGPAEKAANDVGRDFGVNISDSLATELGNLRNTIGQQAAGIFDLDKIIAEGGGLRSDNIQNFTKKLHDTFSLLQTGALAAADATHVLDANFQSFADYYLAKGPLISKDLVDIVKLTDQWGVSSKTVSDFIASQVSSTILPGLQAFTGASKAASDALADNQLKLKDLNQQLTESSDPSSQADLRKQIDDVTAAMLKEQGVIAATAVTSEGAADALGATVAVSFSEMLKAGTPILDIVNKLDPVVAGLATQFQAAGFSGGAAFQKIQGLVALASDEIAGPAIQAATGLGQALAGLSNIGQLDQGTFTGLTDQIDATFNSLVAQGASSSQVLALMQGPLQTIYELQSQFGYAVDDGTKALLDQAVAAGVVGEAQKPIQQQMLDATNTIATAVTGLAKVFGVDLPAAVATGAGAVTAGAQGMATSLGTTVAAGAQTAGGAIAGIPAAMAAATTQATSATAALAAAMSTSLPEGAATASNSISGISGAMADASTAATASLQQLAGSVGGTLPTAVGTATDLVKNQLAVIQKLFAEDTPDSIKAGADAASQLMAALGTDTSGDLDGLAADVQTYLLTALQDIQSNLGDLPGDTATVADEISEALKKIKVPSIKIPVTIDDKTRDGAPDPDTAATGGRVTPTGVQHFALGGWVNAFRPQGTDTVPAMLTPGEVVLNRPQQAAVFSAMAGGLSGRESPASPADLAESTRGTGAAAAGEQHFHFSIQAIDQEGLRQLVTKSGGVAEMVMVAAAQGKHGLDEKFRRALRVP